MSAFQRIATSNESHVFLAILAKNARGVRRKNSGSADDIVYTFTTLDLLQIDTISIINTAKLLLHYPTLILPESNGGEWYRLWQQLHETLA